MSTFKITTVKATPYKSETEEQWSNSYHLSGTEPPDAATWATLATALWDIESLFMPTSPALTHLVHGYGYAPGGTVAVWSGDFTGGGGSAGIAPVGGGMTGAEGQLPLQTALLLRAECGLSAHTGKPRYVMKYIHGVPGGSGEPEATPGINGTGAAGLAKFTSGTLPGGVVLCAPDGTLCSGVIARPYYTTHQIKRRGKRPRRGA